MPTNKEDDNRLLKQAVDDATAGKFEMSIHKVKQVLTKHPDSYIAHYVLAYNLRKERQYPSALESIYQAKRRLSAAPEHMRRRILELAYRLEYECARLDRRMKAEIQ